MASYKSVLNRALLKCFNTRARIKTDFIDITNIEAYYQAVKSFYLILVPRLRPDPKLLKLIERKLEKVDSEAYVESVELIDKVLEEIIQKLDDAGLLLDSAKERDQR